MVERVRDALISTLLLNKPDKTIEDVDALAQAAIDAILSTGDDAGLVGRLGDAARQLRAFWSQDSGTSIHLVGADSLDEAAAAILSLTARNKALEEALRWIAEADMRPKRKNQGDEYLAAFWENVAEIYRDYARAALNHQDNRQKEGGE